jgi:hypothetical protein
MKTYFVLFFLVSSFLMSCGGIHKSRKKSNPPSNPIQKTQVQPAAPKNAEEAPIIEFKEKLVEERNFPVNQHSYFVIIGSFSKLDNARNFQESIALDEFTSVLLRNEAGLYRVSVKSTDDISVARNEIRRIRAQFTKYGDTWLLIRLK